MKLFMEAIEKHGAKENCWIDKIIYWKIKGINIMWDRIGENHMYDEYDFNRKNKHEFSR